MIYTVASDFHQNAKALEYLFQKYGDTQIVLLGDFFDSHGGTDVADAKTMVIALVDLVNQAKIKPILVSGNHDDFITGTACQQPFYFENWMANGGKITLRQLGYTGSKNISAVSYFLQTNYPDVLALLRSAHSIVDEENILFVHAGLDWSKPDPIHDTDAGVATWIREGYLFESESSRRPHRNSINKTIVSGHTPIQSFDRFKNNAWVMHHPLDPDGVNRYLIDGGSGSGMSNAHVNILQFNDLGQLIHEDQFGL